MPPGHLLIKIIESHDTAIPMPGCSHTESSLRPFMEYNSCQRRELILGLEHLNRQGIEGCRMPNPVRQRTTITSFEEFVKDIVTAIRDGCPIVKTFFQAMRGNVNKATATCDVLENLSPHSCGNDCPGNLANHDHIVLMLQVKPLGSDTIQYQRGFDTGQRCCCISLAITICPGRVASVHDHRVIKLQTLGNLHHLAGISIRQDEQPLDLPTCQRTRPADVGCLQRPGQTIVRLVGITVRRH